MPGLPFGSRVLAMVLPFFILLELWVLNRYVGVTLTSEAAVVHNLRRRTIPWANVSEVAVERFAGGRRVVLYETGGRRTPLRMPSSGFLARDRRFDDKVETIRAAGGLPTAAWAKSKRHLVHSGPGGILPVGGRSGCGWGLRRPGRCPRFCCSAGSRPMR
jgi:hypothetical protein